jgi:hypothetical protein
MAAVNRRRNNNAVVELILNLTRAIQIRASFQQSSTGVKNPVIESEMEN